MREFAEINKGVGDVLEHLKTMKYTPDEKIAILRSAAATVEQVVTVELTMKGMSEAFKKILNP